MMPKCPACHANVSKTDTFCPMCGSILGFDTSRVNINASSDHERQTPKFDHIPDPSYTKQYHRHPTKKKSTAPIIAFIVAFSILILGVGGFIFINFTNHSIIEEPAYIEESVDPLIEDFPQYEAELIKLQTFQQGIEEIYRQYHVDALNPDFYVSGEEEYPSIRCIYSGFFGNHGYVSVEYDVLSDYYSLTFNGEELGSAYQEILVDIYAYPLFIDLIDYMGFDKNDYQEALSLYNPSLPLDQQNMAVYEDLENGENACYVWCFEDYESNDYYLMISYTHYEYSLEN